MTVKYKKRLIELAKEVMAFNQDKLVIVDDKRKVEQIQVDMRAQFNEKLYVLLGYILALDEGEEASHDFAKCCENGNFYDDHDCLKRQEPPMPDPRNAGKPSSVCLCNPIKKFPHEFTCEHGNKI